MQRSIPRLMILICAALLAACSPVTTEPSASSSAAPSVAPSAVAVDTEPTATAAPDPTASPEEPPPTATSTPPPDALIVWYGFAEGSPEEQALLALIDRAGADADAPSITARRVPGDQLINKFETEAVAGGGPDLLIAPTDTVGRQARAELIQPIAGLADETLAAYAPASLDHLRVDGRLYGLPLTRSTVALYYNRAAVANPPATTQALLEAVRGGTRAVLIRSAFHSFGFFGAFGGRLLDDSGRCIADQGGFADALRYLQELKAAGAQFVVSGREAEELFRAGEADLTINGDWLLADFTGSLGEQLGVAALPSGPAGPATPLISGVGLLINAGSRQAADARALAETLSSPAAQAELVAQARLIPASPEVAIADDDLGGFAAAALSGVARTQRAELDAFWQPFDAALSEVLEANADPVAAVQAACATMNANNGK